MADVLKLREIDKLHLFNNANNHYVAAAKHVVEKSGLQNLFIKYSQGLNPPAVASSESSKYIVKIAKLLEQIEENGGVLEPVFSKNMAVGEPKYPQVTKVVKTTLAASYGNGFKMQMLKQDMSEVILTQAMLEDVSIIHKEQALQKRAAIVEKN